MKLIINGSEFHSDTTELVKVLKSFGAQEPYVVAINNTFVAKSDYQKTTVDELDCIDVLSPVVGG